MDVCYKYETVCGLFTSQNIVPKQTTVYHDFAILWMFHDDILYINQRVMTIVPFGTPVWAIQPTDL